MQKRWLITGVALFLGYSVLSGCLTQNGNNAQTSGLQKTGTQSLATKNAGWRCSTPKKGSGIVAGFFSGWDQTPFQDRGDGLVPVEAYRCFKTTEACQRWVYAVSHKIDIQSITTKSCTVY